MTITMDKQQKAKKEIEEPLGRYVTIDGTRYKLTDEQIEALRKIREESNNYIKSIKEGL